MYRTPTSGESAPHDLSEAQTKRWSQAEAPVHATAVFPANQIPDGKQASGDLPSSFERATVTYLDANGRKINGAGPGGGITTSLYDVYGNEFLSLTAGNRKRALDAFDGDDAANEAALSATLSTLNVYTPDGRRLTDTFGPEHDVVLLTAAPCGSRAHGQHLRRGRPCRWIL